MAFFEQSDLEKWSRGEWVNTRSVPSIRGFSIDSRLVDSNEMFIALKSGKRDGHAFIGDAEKRGACAALTEQFVPDVAIPQLKVKQGSKALQDIAMYHRRRFNGPVVGISGSCGKTSTKDLIALLLGQDSVLKTPGNLNNTLGVPLTLLRLDNERHRFGVIEAGINSHREMDDLASMIEPEIAVITMIGRAHLEGLGSLEDVAREKARIFHGYKTPASIVFPSSCLEYEAFRDLDHATNRVVVQEGTGFVARSFDRPVYYHCERESRGRWLLKLREDGRPERSFVVGNLSAGMRQNVALAIVTASELGVCDRDIQWRLTQWHPSSNRGEILRTAHNWIYSDCYNANPDSMIDSLRAFESTFDAGSPRLYVLGSMYELGELSDQFHREIGTKVSLRGIDRVICIGSHASGYREGLLAGGNPDEQILMPESLEAVQPYVAEFEGAVFLKGSRANLLERLIPEGSMTVTLEVGVL